MTEVIELELPKETQVTNFEVKMIVASRLYELGKLTSGQAAEMVGLSKRAFLEVLGSFQVSVFGYDADELVEDLKKHMTQVVIADASCLIVLQNIRRLNLLESLFGEISVTAEVEAELGLSLPAWIKVETVQDPTRQTLLELNLDQGEASSIALCLEKPDCLLVIDERKGRRIAKQLNLKIVGTLGIILKAKEQGLIDSLSVILTELENVGFHLSKNLKEKLLDENQD